MQPVLRIATIVMLVLFTSWAGFQYNDPDVLVWVAVYGAAAIQCALFLLGRFPTVLARAFMFLCLFWAIYLAFRVAVAGEFIFDEQGREMLGLLISAGWTCVLYRSSRGPVRADVVRHA